MPRIRVRPLARRQALCLAASTGVGFRGYRTAEAPDKPVERPPRLAEVLSLPIAFDAVGRALADPRIDRGRPQFQPLRGEGRATAARGAAHLLLLQPDALRLALGGLIFPRRLEISSRGDGVEATPRMGPPHRESSDAFHRHQRNDPATHPRVLWPRQRRHLSAGRHRLLHPGRCAARRLLFGGVGARPVQTLRLGRRRVPPFGQTPRGHRLRARCGETASDGRADDDLPRLATRHGHPRSFPPLRRP